MRITGLKTILLNPRPISERSTTNGPNWFFVKLMTDEGIEGLGEAFHSLDEPVMGVLSKFERWLLGKDPTQISHNCHALFRSLRYPPGTATLSALSAIEQAMWDITGKACGLPVYKMLGGPTRQRVQLYASDALIGRENMAVNAIAAVQAGYQAIKFTPHPPGFAAMSRGAVLEESIARVRSVREAVGSGIDIALDYHGRSFGAVDAIRLAKGVEPFSIFFLEEPALTENPSLLAEVKSKTTISIAAGERCVSRESLRGLLEKRAIDIFQPEPLANGGILETVRQAAVADLFGLQLAPHQAASPVSLVVCSHIAASIPNFLVQECNVHLDTRAVQDLIVNPPVIQDGYLELTDLPGLGIELNEDALEMYPPATYDRPIITGRDGAVALE